MVIHYSSNAYNWPLLVTWKAQKGCICTCGKNFFFTKGCDQCHCVYWVRVDCNVMPVSLACHCLVACIGCQSDSPCVSCDHLWACGLLKDSASSLMSASPSSAEASKSRGKHDQMHRVGSRRWLYWKLLVQTHPQMHNTIVMPMHFLVQILRPLWEQGSS